MADEQAPNKPHTTTTKEKNRQSDASGVGTVKVRLVARMWQRPIPDSKPQQFERLNKGDEIEVTEKELEVLNSFKTVFEKVDN